MENQTELDALLPAILDKASKASCDGYAVTFPIIEVPGDAGETIEQLGTQATKTLTTLDAFAASGRLRREAARYWLDLLSRIGMDEFEAIFGEVPDDWISEPAIQFALGMLKINKARLLATPMGR